MVAVAKTQDSERLKTVAKQILKRWSAYFEKTYGSRLPEDYICFDCETTGLSRNTDLPVEIGHVIVRGRKVVNEGSFVLNWADDNRIDATWLRTKLHETKRTMNARGCGYRFTPELLRAEGSKPNKILGFYRDLFLCNRQAGGFLVGQNAWFFDAFLLEGCFQFFLQKPFSFQENELFDTGTMEKACLMGELPRDKETLRQYFLRIKNMRMTGAQWSLGACAERHGLVAKHGLDMKQAHTAKFDSFVCHLLFEEHR